jgi:ParB family chromosome partitioning protein
MAKKPFDLLAVTGGLPSLPTEGSERPAHRPAAPMVPIAAAIENQNKGAMAELKALQSAIEHRRTEGLVIDELDTSLIDPSPYWDRDLRFTDDATFGAFVENIRSNGQQSPALVRPKPDAPERFEICFGHRRKFACDRLGMPLLAVVRPLTEAQMAGAGFSENTHRQGTSILEQARALARYLERGVFSSKQALADALNVSRPHVSNLTSFAEIPDLVLEALGDWRLCSFRDAGSLLKAVRDPQHAEPVTAVAERLIAGDPELGFAARLAALLGKAVGERAVEGEQVSDGAGRPLIERRRSKRSIAFAFAAGADEALIDFVWKRLPTLVSEFEKRRPGKK